jgi:hypothetical protein
VLERAAQSIELVDIDRVALAKSTQQPVKFGSASAGAGHLFLIDELAACPRQGIKLEFQILVTGRDASVANVHGAKVQVCRCAEWLLCTLIAEQVVCTKIARFPPRALE